METDALLFVALCTCRYLTMRCIMSLKISTPLDIYYLGI